jgi:hypothetical protein
VGLLTQLFKKANVILSKAKDLRLLFPARAERASRIHQKKQMSSRAKHPNTLRCKRNNQFSRKSKDLHFAFLQSVNRNRQPYNPRRAAIPSAIFASVSAGSGGIAPLCEAIHAPHRFPASFITASGAPSR